MKVSGAFTLGAPPAEVFAAICDPGELMAVIPGCEEIARTGPDGYEGRIALRLPGVAGSYRTSVRLVDAVPPDRAAMEGRVEGALGAIHGRAEFELAAVPGGTALSYRGRAVIEGPLARLDSRFVERLAESLIAQGLGTLNRRLATVDREPAPVAARHARTEASE